MAIPKWKGTVRKNNLIVYDNLVFLDYLSTMEGKEVTIAIKKFSASRSIPQNKLYFAMLNIVSEYTGHTKDELHEYFKQKYLGDKVEIMDEPFIRTRSTKKLSKAEFNKYLEDIRFYVLDKLELNLPLE